VKKFIEQNPTGRFICVRRGHAFTIVDGVIYDKVTTTPRQFITTSYLVESKRLDTIKAMCNLESL
jgi:hypothetical protein